MISISLHVLPPKTTSQMKRVTWNNGKPRFFKSAAQNAAESSLLMLLLPYQPAAPLAGPVELGVTFTWPHLASTPKRSLGLRLPKATRPDADNLIKSLQDCLVKLRFVEDDGQIASLNLSKFHGPDVGIQIRIAPFGAEEEERT